MAPACGLSSARSQPSPAKSSRSRWRFSSLAIWCYLVANRDKLAIAGRKIFGLQLPRGRDLGPIIAVWLIGIAILVFQRDLGTSLLFFGLFVAMLYVATNRVSWLIIGVALFTPAVVLAISAFPHVGVRFNIWLNAMDPEVYSAKVGSSQQLVQGIS